jgi:hypothetical protein
MTTETHVYGSNSDECELFQVVASYLGQATLPPTPPHRTLPTLPSYPISCWVAGPAKRLISTQFRHF